MSPEEIEDRIREAEVLEGLSVELSSDEYRYFLAAARELAEVKARVLKVIDGDCTDPEMRSRLDALRRELETSDE